MADPTFTGIPWTQPAPGYQPPGFGQLLAATLGDAPIQGPPQQPTVAAGISGNAQSLYGSLASSGGEAVTAGYRNAGAQYGLSSQLQGLSATLNGAFAGDLPYAQQALTTAFDPLGTQQKYYENQTLNATAGALGNQGLAGTPAGAEATGAADAAFQNAWAMNAAQRQQLGAQTATSLQNQYESGQLGAGALISQAGVLNQDALTSIMQGYGLQGQDLAAAANAAIALLGNYQVSVSGGNALQLQSEGTGGNLSTPGSQSATYV